MATLSNEDQLEKAISHLLKLVLPTDAVSFHIPGGGYKLSPHEIGKLKRAGWVPGVPDRIILWNGRSFFLEAKGPRGVVSPSQKEMHPRLEKAGCMVRVVRSIEDVLAALDEFGIPLKTRPLL